MQIPKRQIRTIACIGEVMIELVTQGGAQAQLNVAGDTYNTAVYLARLLTNSDIEVSYVTALGTDRFSDRIVTHMQGHNIRTAHVERREDRMPGLYAIDTDASGERSFSYWRSQSAARTLFSEPAKIGLNALDEFDLLFLSGITLAILPETTRDALFKKLTEFQLQGGTIAYDSNHRPQLWSSEDVARDVNNRMWALTDIALPSVDDEMAIFGEQQEAQVIGRLHKSGVQYGALKRGELGPASLGEPQGDLVFSAVANIVDTTAAGDSFNAGFIAETALGNPLSEALQTGHDLAAKVIQSPGAIIPA